MKLLLDTHAFYLSMASPWEMQVKSQLGKLSLAVPIEEMANKNKQENNIKLLPIDLSYISYLEQLPAHLKTRLTALSLLRLLWKIYFERSCFQLLQITVGYASRTFLIDFYINFIKCTRCVPYIKNRKLDRLKYMSIISVDHAFTDYPVQIVW